MSGSVVSGKVDDTVVGEVGNAVVDGVTAREDGFVPTRFGFADIVVGSVDTTSGKLAKLVGSPESG
ncbi:Hypothetical predicted protein, partial [Olea europaea subsp. europaea]